MRWNLFSFLSNARGAHGVTRTGGTWVLPDEVSDATTLGDLYQDSIARVDFVAALERELGLPGRAVSAEGQTTLVALAGVVGGSWTRMRRS